MNKLIAKTFLWMFVGLLVTFLTGFIVASSENMLISIFASPLFYVIIILEFALVIFFSARVHKMQPITAKMCFLLYSFVSGLTFSVVFVAFELGSVMLIFLIAALVFALFGVIGYVTKIDLSKLGVYLLMALFAVVIACLVNIFVNSSSLDLIVSIIALLVFFGFTAYDVQKLRIYDEMNMDNDVIAINGAFQLYLDFINIFIHLLSIFGNSRD